MKGTLTKFEDKWGVVYNIPDPPKGTATKEWLPLHPNDIDLMLLRGQLPNDQHVMEGMEVDFHFTEKWYEKDEKTVVDTYAKLGLMDFQTKPGFVERRMALGKANNDKQWDEIYDEYSSDQYPAFGGPFTNALEFIVWLKQNYIAPERINNG